MIVLEKSTNLIDNYAPDFELRGADNQIHHLACYLEKFRAVGVIFVSNHCPRVQLYLERLKKIQKMFQHQGLTLVAINPKGERQNTDCSFENLKTFAVRHQLNFPYLWDSTWDVTWSFGAEKAPTAFLVDRKGIIRYVGAIDDNAQPEEVKRHYLRDAAISLLQGKAIQTTSTEPVGDSLKLA